MDLNPVSQILSGQPANVSAIQNMLTLDTSTESPRRKARRIGFIVMGGGLLFAMLFSILGGAFSNLDGDLGSFVGSLGNLGGLIFTVGIGIMIYSFFLSKTPTASHIAQHNIIPPADLRPQMPPAGFQQKVSSVTENTTELLDPEPDRARPRR